MSTPFTTGSFSVGPLSPGLTEARVASAFIQQCVGQTFGAPVCGIVLGSGLGGLVSHLEQATSVPFTDIPGFPKATVAGHAGQFLYGRLAGKPVALMAGRLHMYEGHDAAVAAFPVRVMHALGAPVYVASNAAGGIRRSLNPGDLMVVADHINLMFRSPLSGPVENGDERFPDMSAPYDEELRTQMHTAGRSIGVPLHDGVYCGLLGPTYETPAEIRMLEQLGADAVGMSTVPEVIVARAIGMRTVAVSCITNKAAGLSAQVLNHSDVMDVGKIVAASFEALITEFVRQLR